MVNYDYFFNANASATAWHKAQVLLNLFLQQYILPKNIKILRFLNRIAAKIMNIEENDQELLKF